MDEMNDQTAGPFGLSGEQYWDNPMANKNDLASQRLSNNEYGLLVDGPPEVFLQDHSTVPVLALRVIETYRSVKYSLSTTTQVVSVHLETGAVIVRKLTPYPPPPLPDFEEPPPAPGSIAECIDEDLMEISSIQSDLGSNRVFLLCGPEISNKIMMKIVPGKRGISYKEYREVVDARYNIQTPFPITGSVNKLEIERLNPPEPNSENTVWEMNALKEGEADYRITMTFNIKGINRFIFPEENRPLDNNNNTVFASIPLAMIVFDQDRNTILREQFGIPVTEEPLIYNDDIWLRGGISFLLSNLIDPGMYQYLYTWFICMDNIQMLKIELEEGWEDDLVPPPSRIPKFNTDKPEE
ncbi:hypothetical protein QA601_17135 [Chitinispirillales bacterium ANBcel5]|uniref:hypothetical protein n=1 Tax=Cellulosispirillum alkaliphilum TaxID=3039283 RepID=UPI002A522F04|nr:hypothetical protein [Chitinispirillales bacterium ANBcel5]